MDSLRYLIDHTTIDTSRIDLSIKLAHELTYNNKTESKRLIEECINESKKIGYQAGIADALYEKFVTYAMEGQFETSLKFLNESSKIYQQIGNTIGYANCVRGQGNVYYYIDDLAKAQSYYEDALKIYKKANHYKGMASCISNLGLVCLNLKKNDKALEYQLEGLKLEEKIGNKRGMAISHSSIADVFIELKKYPEAKKHALKSIFYSKLIADSSTISSGRLQLADCYRLMGQSDSAQFYITESINTCEKNDDFHRLAISLEYQIQLYDSLRNYYNAYKTSKRLIIAKDSIFNKDRSSHLVEMQTKFETEKKEKENLLLLSRNFKQSIILWGLLIFVALICFISLQIFISRKKIRTSLENLLILHQEVNQQKEEIETQAESLISANEAIIAQRDHIENTHQKISDSIIYASFIQAAMLPSEEVLNTISSEIFILYKPRDIVSGDFYWFKEKNGNYFLAVADCTGHGVPGALLSMMGISFLNDIVANSTTFKTSDILEELRHNVKLALGQFLNNSLRKDGIEIGLIAYNPEDKTISFSGAYLSLWLSRNGTLKEYKSDRMSIGISLKESPFTQVELDIIEGDTIYMFTDGYADQLGGQTRKKFLRRNLIQEFLRISQRPLCEQKDYLENLHQSWKGDKSEQIDDILVLGIKF